MDPDDDGAKECTGTHNPVAEQNQDERPDKFAKKR
jgi:hypothetical protein